MPPDTGTGFLARFRDWRRSRPFWGGLLVLAGGLEIIYLPLSPVSQLIAAGVVGAQSILVGFLIVILGPFIWFSPSNRTLAGVLAIIFSISSLVLSNLGGLVIGMMAGIIGGALTLAWTDQPRRSRRRRSRPGPGSGSAGSGPSATRSSDSGPSSGSSAASEDAAGSEAGVASVRPSPVPRSPSPTPTPTPTTPGPSAELRTARLSRDARFPVGRRRSAVVVVLVALSGAWSGPAVAAPSSPPSSAVTPAPPPSPSPECLAALAALPSDLLDQLLPALRQLLPGLTGLLPDLIRLLPRLPLLGGPPPPPEPTADEVRTRQLVAAQTCVLPQLLPVGPDGTPLPQLPWLPQLPLPQLPLAPPLVPPVPLLPPAPPQGTAPLLPGLPLPQIPGLTLPRLPLPPLPIPVLPRLPLPGLPLPQLPELPFPELPGLPGLPGVDPPSDAPAPPLPVEPNPDAEQTIIDADDSDLTPTVTNELTMGTLTAENLVYQGIVELPTVAGGTVRALRFTMDTLDADELRIGVPTVTGRRLDLAHAPGEHVLGVGVTLDCTSLSLSVLGVLPLTFTVDDPPPPLLALPSLFGTDVDIDLVTLKLRTLSVDADAGLSGPGTDPPPDTPRP